MIRARPISTARKLVGKGCEQILNDGFVQILHDEDQPGFWNTIELVCFEDRCVHIVNGKVVMALKNARYKDGDKVVPMMDGKLQIQSEAAEVFYRDLQIREIPKMPREYEELFKN